MMMHFIILNDVYVRVRTGAGAARGIGPAGAEVTGSCEQPHAGAGNGAQDLCRNNILR